MAKYQKKKKEVNFIIKFEEGTPSEEECVEDMAKLVFLLFEAQQREIVTKVYVKFCSRAYI